MTNKILFAVRVWGVIVMSVLAIDFFGFCAWVLSGQTPADSFYVGAITTNIIKLFI